jgi:DNA-binding MarR family transcriptional regulator
VSSEEPTRADLRRALDRELGTLGTQAVLLSQAVAERLGLHPTDVEVLDLLNRGGPLTPGRLAELTGLTTGAVTRLIDRLERAGYVRRASNPHDRRSLVVEPVAERLARDLAPLYDSLEKALEELYTSFSEGQLALVRDFTGRVNAAVRAHIARLRPRTRAGPS